MSMSEDMDQQWPERLTGTAGLPARTTAFLIFAVFPG